jgi:ABC-type sugar transport system ATPase subunit
MAFLTVEGAGTKGKERFAVKDIHFTQQSSEKIAIAGETGSGKTSLLKMIGGLLQVDEGSILFKGKRVPGPFEQLIPGHPSIAYLSQHFELRNNYRVEEELESKNLLPDEEAAAIYHICKIEHLLKRRTDQLSGGERQRVVLARLLTTSPKLLLLDEPFSNLDLLHKNIIKTVLSDIGLKLDISCILVSHDAADTLSWADKIIVLKEGRMLQTGTPEEIYYHPVDEYCAGLFGEYNLLSVQLAKVFGTEGDNHQSLIIRPEQVELSVKKEANAVTGTVDAVSFFGSYYSMDISVQDQLLRGRTNEKKAGIGETVYLQLRRPV